MDSDKEFRVASCSSLSDGNSDTPVLRRRSVVGRRTGPTKRSRRGGWTEKEDNVLFEAIKKYNGKNWKKIGIGMHIRLFPCFQLWACSILSALSTVYCFFLDASQKSFIYEEEYYKR
ncbi:hypothetical protein I3842_12G095600 [Carya illinoinensis]|uniref:Uncharacterized protein n=1 Tax=Carya illinoinensis TaxID=32201 RepID=A0A922DIM7_CARIL|nr:hypothetical protein I3842_12G095600 [Carya illinoinensis]